MKTIHCTSATDLGERVALATKAKIDEAIALRGSARVLFSTGASQFTTFEALLKLEIDWTKVEAFHLDEYLGIDDQHPASFIKYLKERFANRVQLKTFILWTLKKGQTHASANSPKRLRSVRLTLD